MTMSALALAGLLTLGLAGCKEEDEGGLDDAMENAEEAAEDAAEEADEAMEEAGDAMGDMAEDLENAGD
jgi:hypothetical protein